MRRVSFSAFPCPGFILFSALLSGGLVSYSQDSGAKGTQTALKPLPDLTVAKSVSKASDNDRFSGKIVATRDMAWDMIDHREGNAPRPGEMAPNFSLPRADDGGVVSLKDLYLTKPVVLLFSSWGCDIFRETLGGLQSLQTEYGDRAHFVMVYIREAHPFDGFGGGLGRVKDPRTDEERAAIARKAHRQMRLPFLVLVDPIEDPTATRWAGWPVRPFVIDTSGKVVYAGAQGPWGYRPYRGFLHGNGKLEGLDREFSSETLEEYLEKRFPKANGKTVN
ncbi:MAG: redoxin domain-containing protein [Verrucomicrobiales bacterium]|nr:redoxin domain-containing protein [Verrucomicrobiales bacterium]